MGREPVSARLWIELCKTIKPRFYWAIKCFLHVLCMFRQAAVACNSLTANLSLNSSKDKNHKTSFEVIFIAQLNLIFFFLLLMLFQQRLILLSGLQISNFHAQQSTSQVFLSSQIDMCVIRGSSHA